MAFFIRSLRTPLTRALISLRPLPLPRPLVARAFTSSALRFADSHGSSGPPQLYGPGGKAGEVPTDEEQATGIERFELLGDLMGVDVFDLKPIDMTRMGTMADPIPIFSLVDLASYSCL
ncbi:MAG: Cytochrome c oxidase subunit 4 [Tremellales sp. Tagirdzhanova-0007]|nr:MAG: Cytochrome c oxidase subunit 4 [Tremellales sp. Tagirdzhanova-0007]